MRNINVTINTRNAFVRESLVAMVNDLTRGDLRARFSWRNTDLSAEDIIICEVIPGEIYLCNTLIKNRKRGSSLIILHSCPHRVLSRSQTAVVHGILEGLDMSKIAALQRVSPRTAAYHKNKIMEKYSLNNNHEFFQFMNLLRERW